MLRIGIVAGEASGDYLGAHLIKSLKLLHGDITVEGIGGRKMQAEGCRSIFPIEKLGVMGIVEVLGSYFELVQIRRTLIRHFTINPPDIFIGIDAPDFNLGLEQTLREKGVKTVHYVSPSVWAWRKYRISKIARSVDMMLTLFPFELDIYKQHNIPAECVGHPLAEQIAMKPHKSAARQRLGIDQEQTVIALLPGSRKSEIGRLLPPFLETARLCHKKSDKVLFISSLLDSNSLRYCEQIRAELSLEHLPLKLYEDRVHDVLEASDVILLASGTITLEAMLYKRPMVVAYKLNPVSHLIVKMLTYVDHASLPNLLAGRELVPECLQNECHPEGLFKFVQHWLTHPEEVTALEDKFTQIHTSLKNNNGETAACAVLNLLNTK
ncbi:MAG: lipid-A-disaccharide synthase [Planctomycetota bacterium]|jgi:lipid-A-disaccharide synthase